MARAKQFILIVVAALAMGCGVRMGGSSGAPTKYMTTYFRGEKGTLYFLKPVKWKSEDGEKLESDITFTYNPDNANPAIVNFTLYSEENIKAIDGVTLDMDEYQWKFDQVKNIFSEPRKKGFANRFTFEMEDEQLFILLQEEELSMTVESKGKSIEFWPSKFWERQRGYVLRSFRPAIDWEWDD